MGEFGRTSVWHHHNYDKIQYRGDDGATLRASEILVARSPPPIICFNPFHFLANNGSWIPLVSPLKPGFIHARSACARV